MWRDVRDVEDVEDVDAGHAWGNVRDVGTRHVFLKLEKDTSWFRKAF